MKSIYEKIMMVLIIGFIIQVVLVAVFYRQVAVKRIISEINAQEDKRRAIMEEAHTAVQRLNNKTDKLEAVLDALSQKNKIGIEVRNLEGELQYSSNKYLNKNTIEEQSYVRTLGKISHIVYGYFPPNLSLDQNAKQSRFRIITVIVIFCVALITLFIIYKTLADPLKKLSKAVSELRYGNTVVSIPYYGEDELGLLCRNFESMGERLKKSEKLQQDLIQAISHDVKTPLTSIIGFSKRLLDGKVNEAKRNEYYETIFRKATDLKLLLEELDDYSNFDIETKYDKRTLGFREYYMDIFSELSMEIADKGGTLIYSTEIDEKIKVNIDTIKMKRVFTNIVENSVKYSEGCCKINASASYENNAIFIRICDEGMGVSEEQLERIFDRFYRVDSSRSREKGGTGLGLAICKQIIEGHGGSIGAKNNPQKGLCICFSIPAKV